MRVEQHPTHALVLPEIQPMVIDTGASTQTVMAGMMPMMRFQMNRANGSIKTVMATVTTRLGPNQMRARAYRATQHLTDLDAPMMMAMVCRT
jgi:hypothetical protein